jgi:hypothetical protein
MGFELVGIGPEGIDAFMREKTRIYSEGRKQMGLGK